MVYTFELWGLASSIFILLACVLAALLVCGYDVPQPLGLISVIQVGRDIGEVISVGRDVWVVWDV